MYIERLPISELMEGNAVRGQLWTFKPFQGEGIHDSEAKCLTIPRDLAPS